MKLENAFEVPAPPDRVWRFLLDVERVAPCMPGAELTEVIDERHWKGRVGMRLGPVSLAYAGTVEMAERDDAERRVVLKAKGMEQRGKGMASAVVTSRVLPAGDGARVEVVTDLTISGPAAQYGRGMIADVSQRFTDEFAANMAAQLAPAAGAGEPAAAGGEARPISGLRLALWALWRALLRGLRRLAGKGG
ncbi:MAG: carbon monoxide dehydrogenase [Acidobacteria bacterium]|nr:MAG: carbon monoxide dehydrogenase [Acidobacteriota bacterium]